MTGRLKLWFVRLPQRQALGNGFHGHSDVLGAQQCTQSGGSESHIKQRSGSQVVNSETVRRIVNQQPVWIKAVEHGSGKTPGRVEVGGDQSTRVGPTDEISNSLKHLVGVGPLRQTTDYGGQTTDVRFTIAAQ